MHIQSPKRCRWRVVTRMRQPLRIGKKRACLAARGVLQYVGLYSKMSPVGVNTVCKHSAGDPLGVLAQLERTLGSAPGDASAHPPARHILRLKSPCQRARPRATTPLCGLSASHRVCRPCVVACKVLVQGAR